MRLFSLLTFIIISQLLGAQAYFTPISSEIALKNKGAEREIVPLAYDTYQLDIDGLIKRLAKANHQKKLNPINSDISLTLPIPDGDQITFNFVETSVMSPELGKKFPTIKSYLGVSKDNRGTLARIDFGEMGFHAVIKTPKGTVYIDPYFLYADEHYITYYIKDDIPTENERSATCGYNAYKHDLDKEKEQFESPVNTNQQKSSAPVVKRTYRMALACTGRWGSLWGNEQEVMSRFVTGVNRLNIIFENEMAINFQLIDDNDQLIFFDSNEPYSSPSLGGVTLGENTGVINNAVGADSYDIGHVFTVNCTDGVAGIAFGGSMCRGNKGGGVSCIGARNISNFMVSTTAHEIGHQLSGGHSWNNCPNAIAQLSSATAWEPGSGSTILSYSGLCGNNNVTGPNDDYFHVGNLQQFYEFVENSNCGIIEDSGNNTPELEVPIGDGLTIPIETPFELDGIATDPDGDIMTYNWEQMDLGPISELGMPLGNAPSFRSLEPTPNTKRTFPRINDILNGTRNDREVLPNINRRLTFRFVAKDNHPGAGSTTWEQIRMESDISAGPFVVTTPSELAFAEVGKEFLVEWDVANTDNAIIDCQTVDIYLSTDGGFNFDVLLAEDTPNDGSESIMMPNILTSRGRIKVKASNNVFFNIGRGEVIVRGPSSPGFFVDISENQFDVCLPDDINLELSGTSFLGFSNPIDLDIVSGLPPNATFDFTNNPMSPDGESSLNIDLSNEETSGDYEVVLRAISQDADTVFQTINLRTVGTKFDDLSLQSPISGTAGLNGTPEFTWNGAQNASSYQLEVSTSPAFGSDSEIIEPGILGESIIPLVVLGNSELYYWRIIASNDCVQSFESEIFTFGTVTLNCKTYEAEDLPKNISQSGTPSVTSTIQVFDQGTVADVNVLKIEGGHGRSRDLAATLINPEGLEIRLFDSACSGANFNLGFDSDSPIEFGCPLSTGNVMKPEESTLFGLNGGQIEGNWSLRLDDERAGEGGRFDQFILELCSSSSFDNPFIVNNNVLEVPTGFSDKIFSDLLLSEDNNNTASELIYTMVVLPMNGTLYLNGQPVEVGTQFTQEDINSGALRYVHEGTEDESDEFIFTVIDGEGGWIDLTTFTINMEADFASSVEELNDANTFSIFPNPTKDLLNIHSMKFNQDQWDIKLFSLDGQLILTDRMEMKKQLDIQNLDAGIYILQINNIDKVYTQKISIID